MTNTGRKGAANESEAVELCRAAGFDAYTPQRVTYGDNDLHGLFDVSSIHAATGRVVFAQVKTNRAAGITDWFREADALLAESCIEPQFWVRHDGTNQHDPPAWRVAVLCDDVDGYEWAVDEREDRTPADGNGVVAWLRNP